ERRQSVRGVAEHLDCGAASAEHEQWAEHPVDRHPDDELVRVWALNHGLDRKALMRALGLRRPMRWSLSSAAAWASSARSRPSRTPPRSDLWAMSSERILTTMRWCWPTIGAANRPTSAGVSATSVATTGIP